MNYDRQSSARELARRNSESFPRYYRRMSDYRYRVSGTDRSSIIVGRNEILLHIPALSDSSEL